MFRNYKTWSRANYLPSRVFGKEKDSWKMEDNYLQEALDEVFSFSNFFFVSEGYLL